LQLESTVPCDAKRLRTQMNYSAHQDCFPGFSRQSHMINETFHKRWSQSSLA
jgi:hypothetical protein